VKNIYTSGFLQRGRLPLVYPTDEEAIEMALDHAFRANPQDRHTARVMRIASTLDLEAVQVTENLLDEVRRDPGFADADAAEMLEFRGGMLF
jgi:hypothetical protein